ncbi:hypothetical protein [Ilumatobacter sp.]|uniref:hypothetical protein n=1 Tax=Ilumatobacter sp. TaxID=1967498 RepID=UPI003C55B9BB
MSSRAPRPTPLRWALASAIVILALVVGGGTAHADPAGPTDYRSEILSVEPATTGVSLDILGGDSFVQLTAEPGTEATVVGYFGEPYLWFLPDGEVRENRNSPTSYQNENRYGADAPDFATADADPDWETVARSGSFAWHDHRAHWMQPIRPAGQEPGDQILEQVIPITVNGEDVAVTVISTWEPEPSMLPAIIGGLLGAAVVAVAVWLSRRSAGWAIVLAPVALAALVAGWWQYTSLPAETGPRLVWPLLPALAVVAAVAAYPLRNRSPFLAQAAGLVAASELVVWAFIKRDGLTAAIVPTGAPQWFERLVLVAAFVAGVGGVVLAISRLFFMSPGTRDAVATT